MTAARTRIGRITLKSGGSVRLLEAPRGNKVTERLRQFTSDVTACERLPDAFLAATFIYEDGAWEASVSWESIVPAMPCRMLPVMTERTAEAIMTTTVTEDRIYHSLGYTQIDPDPAA